MSGAIEHAERHFQEVQPARHVPNGTARIAGAAHTDRVSMGIPNPTAVGEREPGLLRRAAVVAGDLMGLVAIAFCIPFVILAITTPIALFLRLLLWIGGLL